MRYHLPMNDWKNFRKRRKAIFGKYDPLLVENRDNVEKCAALEKLMHAELADVQRDEEVLESNRLVWRAHWLDIELPSRDDKDAWADAKESDFSPLMTPKGRLLLRRAIDEEKTRRRDVAAWWWKTIILPTLAGLTGLVGAITGLVAVLHRK